MNMPPAAGLHRRKAPLQARSAVTVDAILEATIQVLLSAGPARLTTTRVAVRAGVSVGTLYQYFPNKSALLYAALERHLTMLVDAVEAGCGEQRGASLARMAEALVHSYLRAKLSQREASQALYLVGVELPAQELLEAAMRRAEAIVSDMVATARDGTIGDPAAIARMLLAAIHGTARTYFERDLTDIIDSEVEAHLTAMCGAYLMAVADAPALPA